MWGSNTKVRAALIAVFALAFMTLGLATAFAQSNYDVYDPSITAQSNACETVTIYYKLVEQIPTTTTPNDTTSTSWEGNGDKGQEQAALAGIPFNAYGTINTDDRDTAGVGTAQIVFTGVASGPAIPWSGSMSWLAGPDYPAGEYANKGTVQVEPCPVTTTTAATPTTTQPGGATTSSTLAQVDTDLPDSGGSSLGMMAALAAVGVSLLGGAAIVASRREN